MVFSGDNLDKYEAHLRRYFMLVLQKLVTLLFKRIKVELAKIGKPLHYKIFGHSVVLRYLVLRFGL